MRAVLFAFGLFWLLVPGARPGASAELAIGTGSTEGVYYALGRSICRFVNRGSAEHGVTCTARPTDGSVANIEGLRSGELQIGIVQSDIQFHALHGSGPFQGQGAFEQLRALFSAHGEPFTVVARNDAGFSQLDDLKGGRVNLGNPGSGQRATMDVVMEAKGWTPDDFVLAGDLTAAEHALALCHDRIQALVYTVGHPNPSIAQATGLCEAHVVEVEDEAIDKLVAEQPFYTYTEVPGGVYPGNPDPVVTFGVKATVVTTDALDPQVVEVVLDAVFGSLDEFRRMHPAFAILEAETMTRDALSAPLHPAAEDYFTADGLL